jgi:serine protease Do
MKPMNRASVLVVALGLAAQAVMAQDRPERSRPRTFGWPDGDRALNIMAGGATLGVSARDLEPAEADRQKLSGGAVIEDVREETPAANAGLRRNDIVVEFDGERVRSAQQFSRLVRETAPGRTVTAAIVRDGQRSSVQVTPSSERGANVFIDGNRLKERIEGLTGRMPEFDLEFGMPGSARVRLGVTVTPLSDQLATYFGAKQGVLISAVEEGSAADRAGLKAGDVITSLEGELVRSSADITRVLRNLNAGATEVSVEIVRDKQESTVKATIEARDVPRSARPI